MEKPVQEKTRVAVGVLARRGNVSPPMAMFLASQPYFWTEFDCKIFDGRSCSGWPEAFLWLGKQDCDYYALMDADVCPDPYVLQRLVSRGVDVVVPPVWEQFNGQKVSNVIIDNKRVCDFKDCGFEPCDDSSVSILCISRRVLSHLFMAMERINGETMLASIKNIGYQPFVDWTIAPTFKWEDEFRDRNDIILHAYGVWYTRVKRGLPV